MRITVVASVSVIIIGAALFVSSTRADAQRSRAVLSARCLHDTAELQADRVRREQALSLAREINAAQGRTIKQTGRYQPLQQLGILPETPAGFVVRLHADEEGYIFSVKDDRDACRYGIFSDQQGTLYQSSPTPPLVAS